VRLAYFTSCYPRATDTFIRREAIGLRARGFEVFTYSVHQAGSGHDVDPEVQAEKQATQYLLPVNYLSLLLDILALALTRPVRVLRTLWLALTTSRAGVKGHALQMAYLLEAILLSRRLKKDGIEHVHNHLGDSSGNVTLFTALILDIPFSISIHGPHIFFDAGDWALDVKARYAKFIACIGYYCRSQVMLNIDKAHWDKLKIVRCGIDPDAYRFRVPDPEVNTLLFVGRLDVEKGIPILFASMDILQKQGYDLKLVVLGDGRDRQFLESMAEQMGLSGNVDFRGFVGQDVISDELSTSDVFVLPSFAEGIPVSLMEAMATGIPVIATNVGGVSELVVNHETGLIVPASDEVSLTNAIARYVDQPEFYQETAKKARVKVTEGFNIEKQVDELASLFRS